jgi:hypothetical protein
VNQKILYREIWCSGIEFEDKFREGERFKGCKSSRARDRFQLAIRNLSSYNDKEQHCRVRASGAQKQDSFAKEGSWAAYLQQRDSKSVIQHGRPKEGKRSLSSCFQVSEKIFGCLEKTCHRAQHAGWLGETVLGGGDWTGRSSSTVASHGSRLDYCAPICAPSILAMPC